MRVVGSVAAAAVGFYFGGPSGAAVGWLLGSWLFGPHTSSNNTGMSPQAMPSINQALRGTPVFVTFGTNRVSSQIVWTKNFQAIRQKSSGKGGSKDGGSGNTGNMKGAGSVTANYNYIWDLMFNYGMVFQPSYLKQGWIGSDKLGQDVMSAILTGYSNSVLPASDDQSATLQFTESWFAPGFGTGSTQLESWSYFEQQEGVSSAWPYTVSIGFKGLQLGSSPTLPQLSFEIGPYASINDNLQAITMIPGATEFGYEPATVTMNDDSGLGVVNRHDVTADSDVMAALDQLVVTYPQIKNIAVVAAWFGTDLRAGNCVIKPGSVDGDTGGSTPYDWKVGDFDHSTAYVVSRHDGRAAYGGSPADLSIINLVTELKARGYNVTLYPFIMMDIATGNTLPNPYSNNAAGTGQAAYPWRGRITCSPAPGYTGTVDNSATAATQIGTFFGDAVATDFSWATDHVHYSGSETGYRKFILHYATLAKQAGVDAMYIGSEMIGITRVRSSSGVYPAVQELKDLLSEVRAKVGSGIKLAYAADWTEYTTHVIGSEVRFPLDPLWADSNLDAVAIDYYMPFSDWRDGTTHLDYSVAEGSIYNLQYLGGRVESGENYDWYYASQSDRDAQIRSTISDGAYNKPWVYRSKDLWSWWENLHYERNGSGTESGTPTAWVAQSKPIWISEIGCPAVDKGANEPNVFPDPKSSENASPYYSSGERDDKMQQAYLQAFLTKCIPNIDDTIFHNPISTVYNDYMIPPDRIYAWTWDARPYPQFPEYENVWGDGPNYTLGHWLEGRQSFGVDLTPPEIIKEIMSNPVFGIGIDTDAIDMTSYYDAVSYCNANGVLISVTYSNSDDFIQIIDELLSLYGGYIVQDAGTIKFGVVRDTDIENPDPVVIDNSRLISPGKGQPPVTVTKGALQDGYNKIKFSYLDRDIDYKQNQIEVSDEVDIDFNGPRPKEFPAHYVMTGSLAQMIAERALWSNLYGRDTYSFKLGAKDAHRQPGDIITLVDSYHPELSGGVTARITYKKESSRLTFDVSAVQAIPYHSTAGHGYTATASISNGTVFVEPAAAPLDFRMYELPYEFQGGAGRAYVGYNQGSNIMGAQLWLSSDGDNFALAQDVQPFIISGILASPLQARPPGYMERGVKLYLMPSSNFNPAAPTFVQTYDLDDISQSARAAGLGVLVVGSEAVAMEGLTLLDQNTYRVDRLYRGWGGTPIIDHTSGAYWHYQSAGIFTQQITLDQVGTVVHYKVVPYNFSGRAYNISSIDARTYQLRGLYWLPRVQPQQKIFIQSAANWSANSPWNGTQVRVASGGCDFTFQWPAAAQNEGYGAGGFGANSYGHFAPDILTPSYRVDVYSMYGSVNSPSVSYVVNTGYFKYTVAASSRDFNGFMTNIMVKVTPFTTKGDGPTSDVRSLNISWW